MGIFFHEGSVGQPGVGSSTRDFEMWLKGALDVECLCLWELCEGNLEEGSSTRDFESWMKGALGMEHLSLKRLCGGGLRGNSFAGDPGDMLRKFPDTGISLHEGPFPSEVNLVCGGGSYTGDFDR